MAAGRYTSPAINRVGRDSSLSRRASFAAVVVLPEPCSPTIITIVGGTELSFSPSRCSPNMLASSSCTILTSCCAGETVRNDDTPTDFFSTRSRNSRVSWKFTSASRRTRRTSRRPSLISASVSTPRPRRRANVASSFSDSSSNIARKSRQQSGLKQPKRCCSSTFLISLHVLLPSPPRRRMARNQRKEEILKSELPPALPLMALRSTIVYPLGTIAVQMGAPENLALLRANEEPGLIVALVVASGDHDEPVEPGKFVGRVGVAARVHERINLPGDTVQITLQGLRRITVEAIEQTQPYAIASIKAARETPAEPAELEDLVARVVSAAETLADLVDRIPDEVPQILKMNVSDPGRFADLAATNMNFRISDKDEVLQRLDVGQRIRFILSRLEREVARARVMEDVKRQTEVKIEQHQREFYLRQQLRAIQAELGEADPGEKEALEILKKIEDAKLPDKVAQEARRETERMRMLSPASSEYQVVRTYLDWVLSLPWNKKSGQEQIDLKIVEAALDAGHYGLDEAKERIIEYLAVRKLRGGDPHGPILCLSLIHTSEPTRLLSNPHAVLCLTKQ